MVRFLAHPVYKQPKETFYNTVADHLSYVKRRRTQ